MDFQTENLMVDYITLTIENSLNQDEIDKIASYFSKKLKFNSSLKENKNDPIKKLQFGHRKKYHVLIEIHWCKLLIKFSGTSAKQLYTLIKRNEVDWEIFENYSFSLSRFDLCHFRIHDCINNNKNQSVDKFLVDSRSHVQTFTTTRHILLKDEPKGKILKINRRSNGLHYRVYEKENGIRFELEIKRRQIKSVEDYFFQKKLGLFESELTQLYYQYSEKIFPLENSYVDWLLNFKRKYPSKKIPPYYLLTSYLENNVYSNDEEERIFHLLQYLSFVKTLTKDQYLQTHSIKNKVYYIVKFSLRQFLAFTGVKITNSYQRKQLLVYFKKLQKLDPIVTEFSDGGFQSYVVFPYVDMKNKPGNSWMLEVYTAQELIFFPYPFGLTKSFLNSKSKNDLRLKVRLMQALATNPRKKCFDLQEYFNQVSVAGNRMVVIKKEIIRLLTELSTNNIIEPELEIVYKSGKEKQIQIKELNTFILNRRIHYLKLYEIF